MKKFISMVMAAAMVVSLVPATAFAAGEASLRVVKAAEATKADAQGWLTQFDDADAEIQIKLNDVDTKAGEADSFDFDLNFDNAVLTDGYDQAGLEARFLDASTDKWYTVPLSMDDDTAVDDDYITLTITEPTDEENGDKVIDFDKGDTIAIVVKDLNIKLEKAGEGKTATVFVSGDFGTTDEKVFASVLGAALKASVKKTVDVAEDETAELKDITIEAAVGNLTKDIKLTLSKGFEFVGAIGTSIDVDVDGYTAKITDEDEITIEVPDGRVEKVAVGYTDKIKLSGIVIEATSAKAGAVATITAKANGFDSAKVEVAKVVEYKVVMSVDEDADVPVFYAGVNSKDEWLTSDDDHKSLEVTIEETFEGAWNLNKDFTLELPEGVHVVKDGVEADGMEDGGADLDAAFEAAYQKGDHESFVFKKRTFDNTEPGDGTHELNFTLTLVADPDFEGDVVLKLTGDAVDEQEVTIAKFVPAYTVKAAQNDLKIDYRYTEIPTEITITEAEAGLWKAGFYLTLGVDYMQFEDDATFTVNEDSDMEIKDTTKNGRLTFEVKEESDDEAAVITISDMQLYMQRNLPAGPYDLEVVESNARAEFLEEGLFAPDHANCDYADIEEHDNDAECFVDDVDDFSKVVKEAFVNIITAGREVDDASFTTKVVVPVGESYIVAGENQVALDVPAYINAAGYTMLPVRAVAVALGINTNNVLWDAATKTVTILYGQRIITMVAGQKVVYVNGSAIPASAAVEIVDGRTFLPMRDLATALGVTDITWDAATKTATLNGSQK